MCMLPPALATAKVWYSDLLHDASRVLRSVFRCLEKTHSWQLAEVWPGLQGR